MARLVTSGFDPGDDDTVVAILNKWGGGPFSDALFTQIAMMTPQLIIEVVVLREEEEDGVIETLLLPRPPGDIVWPGMVHIPGTALRLGDFLQVPLDTPQLGAFGRIRQEIGQDFADLEFVGMHYGVGKRGAASSEVWVATLADGELPEGTFWYRTDKLASLPTFIQDQLPFVRMAVAHFIQGG